MVKRISVALIYLVAVIILLFPEIDSATGATPAGEENSVLPNDLKEFYNPASNPITDSPNDTSTPVETVDNDTADTGNSVEEPVENVEQPTDSQPAEAYNPDSMHDAISGASEKQELPGESDTIAENTTPTPEPTKPDEIEETVAVTEQTPTPEEPTPQPTPEPTVEETFVEDTTDDEADLFVDAVTEATDVIPFNLAKDSYVEVSPTPTSIEIVENTDPTPIPEYTSIPDIITGATEKVIIPELEEEILAVVDETDDTVIVETDVTDDTVIVEADVTDDTIIVETDVTDDTVIVEADVTDDTIIVETDVTDDTVIVEADVTDDTVIVEADVTDDTVIVEADVTDDTVIVEADVTDDTVIVKIDPTPTPTPEVDIVEEEVFTQEYVTIPEEPVRDTTYDFVYYNNADRETNMILFEDPDDHLPPSLRMDFEDIQLSEQYPWYKAADFVPDSEDDFFRSEPEFMFNNNSIIMPSLIIINAELGRTLFEEAYSLFNNNNHKAAMLIFRKLVHYNYRISDCYYYLSWYYYVIRDYFTAINYMDKAIDLAEMNGSDDARIADYLTQIGQIYFTLDEYAKAMLYFSKSIEKAPSYTEAYNKLGLTYYTLNNYEKALEIWKEGSIRGNRECRENYTWLSGKYEE